MPFLPSTLAMMTPPNNSRRWPHRSCKCNSRSSGASARHFAHIFYLPSLRSVEREVPV